jgi:HD-GYP domain-containing protein (c-di-GMP phosphodiesterase class II)
VALVSVLLSLSRAIESREPHSRGHSARVSALAEIVAVHLGWDEARRGLLRLGGALHDIGKIAVRETVLRKPGPLSEAERAEVLRHPEAGARLVALVEQLHSTIPAVLHHHERWDGRGYPAGRARDEIPEEARILAVADSFDAMTSHRPYRRALPAVVALEEVERCAGTQFDPDVALVFIEAWESGALGVTTELRSAAR